MTIIMWNKHHIPPMFTSYMQLSDTISLGVRHNFLHNKIFYRNTGEMSLIFFSCDLTYLIACGNFACFRPPLSKKSFPVSRVSKKNGQSGGRDFFFFSNFVFYKLQCTSWESKKKIVFKGGLNFHTVLDKLNTQ